MSALDISVDEVAAALRGGETLRLLDVREDWEFKLAAIPGAELLTEALATELMQAGDRSARYIFTCHHGIRSMQAAVFFARQGFTNVRSMSGGIDEWSQRIDESIPRY